jgi:Fe-S-cluster-containing dehydrogenase component
MLACARYIYKNFSIDYSAIRIHTSGGYQAGVMIADVCRGCKKPDCVEYCPVGALLPREGGGVRLIRDKCNGCKACLAGCPIKTITFEGEVNLPIVCIQCGWCVKFCPHGCIEMREA